MALPYNYNSVIFINNPYEISQDTNIYGQYINEEGGITYDYVFKINVHTNDVTDITQIFSTATYTQDTTNLELYNVDLTLNTDYINIINNTDMVTIDIAASARSFATLNPYESEKVGDRLLEVVAHKIFGHGQARAAIKNDLEFFTHDGELWTHLANSVNTPTFRNDIFNQYVAMGRYNTFENGEYVNNYNDGRNDVNTDVQFNFTGLTFDFPLWLNGVINLDNRVAANEADIFRNGPDVLGTKLVNGVYNIPILVKFSA